MRTRVITVALVLALCGAGAAVFLLWPESDGSISGAPVPEGVALATQDVLSGERACGTRTANRTSPSSGLS